MLEFAYNTKKPDERDYISYQIVYGETSAMTAKKRQIEVQKLQQTQKDTGRERKNLSVPEYRQGDWTYLRRRRGRKDRLSVSLDHRWWRLFRIKRKTGPQDVELKFPKKTKLHPVVNVSKLKSHYGPLSEKAELLHVNEDATEYEVEEVQGERKDGQEFLIKWKDYKTTTWEPKWNLNQTVFSSWTKRKNGPNSHWNDRGQHKRHYQIATTKRPHKDQENDPGGQESTDIWLTSHESHCHD